MKLKIALSIVVLLIFIVAVNVYAYNASAWCVGYSWTGLKWAAAATSSSGLRNGTYNVFAQVDTPKSDSGAFVGNTVYAYVSDLGSYSFTATANAYVGGYDSASHYQSDNDRDTL